MFVDYVKVFVKGGDGGRGMVAFRREAHVPKGGPAGGDGGKGGNVVFRVEEGLRTLLDFRYQRHFKAKKGENGRSKGQHGANAKDLIVLVPPGTLIRNAETQELIADLTMHQQEVIVAKGGRGGRGNIRFATPANPAPHISENGEPGEELWVELELKVLADVGLVGYPSVGKSTLLSVVSAARPKIAAYHFTTLKPNLGMVRVASGQSFVLADLPGLIEGAHEGVGLGHQFLRHVERTKVLIHVLDMAGSEGRDPFEDFEQINQELTLYKKELSQRPQLIVANKMDLPGAEEQLDLFRQKLDEAGYDYPLFPLSAISQQGIQPLLYAVMDKLKVVEKELREVEPQVISQERKRFVSEPPPPDFEVLKENDEFVVRGERVEKLLAMSNLDHYDSLLRFSRQLRKMGIEDALREKGAQEGDTVRIGEMEFTFSEHLDE